MCFACAELADCKDIHLNVLREHLIVARARCEAAGALVKRTHPDGPLRVCKKSGGTGVNLAMSRSIGDHLMKSVGVIAEPEITVTNLSADDRCLVLASDGGSHGGEGPMDPTGTCPRRAEVK